MKRALALIFLLASSLASLPASASEATDLASLVIAAYGGPEVLEQNKTVQQTGALTSNRHGKTGRIERTFSRPDKLRIDIRIPGEPPESRTLNGEQAWRDAKAVPPMMARAMALQAARLDLPYLIMTAGERLKMAGPISADEGRDLKGLEIAMAEGVRLIAVVDVATGYIVGSHGLILVAPNHEMDFSTVYAGHKEINGTVLATEEVHFVQGQPTGRTVIDQSKSVQEVSDAVFRP